VHMAPAASTTRSTSGATHSTRALTRTDCHTLMATPFAHTTQAKSHLSMRPDHTPGMQLRWRCKPQPEETCPPQVLHPLCKATLTLILSNAVAVECCRVLSRAVECCRVPSSAVECCRVLSSAVECCRVLSSAVECRRVLLPRLPLRGTRHPASPVTGQSTGARAASRGAPAEGGDIFVALLDGLA